MSFDAYDVSVQLVRSLRKPLELITARDVDLGRQLRRAAASVPLNLSEGRRRAGKDRKHLWRVASGSANEVKACLDVAAAFGYVEDKAVAGSLELVDRVLAMCWRMTC